VASDHFDGRRFRNPWGGNGQPFWRVPKMLLTSRSERWPLSVPVTPSRPPALRAGDDVVVTFIGHATLLIQTAAGHVITDPVYAQRASPVQFAGPKRVRQPGVLFDDLPPIAAVLVSHNHYDHCDLATLRALGRRFSPVFVTPLANRKLLESAGLRRIEELDWWQEARTTPVPVTLTPAQHFSARGPFDRNRALWGSFVVTAGRRRVYFGGDTGYGPHFAQVSERLGPMDVALLPIGAYEPRWFMKDIHVNPDEAVRAHLDLRASLSIGMHFGTFQLTPEGIDAPVAALAEARAAHQVPDDHFRTLDFGGSLRL
jgi:L-ascorbate metabolism protein UlaG (beta-lactamase superfamily)